MSTAVPVQAGCRHIAALADPAHGCLLISILQKLFSSCFENLAMRLCLISWHDALLMVAALTAGSFTAGAPVSTIPGRYSSLLSFCCSNCESVLHHG